MSAQSKTESELTQAAESFETELQRFEKLSLTVQKEPLTSQKHLERAAQALRDVADSDAKLVLLGGKLLASLTKARDRQQTHAQAVNQRAEEIQQRSEQLQALMVRYGELGTTAAELNQRVQELASQKGAVGSPERAKVLLSALGEVQPKMGELAEQAEQVAAQAEEQGFPDVSRNADSLRQQLLSAKNKLGLLQKNLEVV